MESNKHPIKILELFGGVGSPRCALRNIGIRVTWFESIFRKILLNEVEDGRSEEQISLI